jgi:hypothetical protein
MRRSAVPVALLALAAVLALPACTATRLEAEAQLPPPLIDKLPVRVGIHYPREFREFVHKETRGSIDYEVTLGPAHVTNLDWLLKAMFRDVVPVEDPKQAATVTPPLVLVLEPQFEEYSFLTPKDVAGEAFIVTIRYLLNLYDSSGSRVDSFTYTGYGRERARTLASKEPLQVATQRAMRDAGAKVAVELSDQEAVRLLVRNAGRPAGAPPKALTAPMPPPVPAGGAQPPAQSATPPAQPEPAPQTSPPPAQEQPTEEAPAEESPAPETPQDPPTEEPAEPAQPPEEVPPEESPTEEPPSEQPPSPEEQPPAEETPAEPAQDPSEEESVPPDETETPEEPDEPPPSVGGA